MKYGKCNLSHAYGINVEKQNTVMSNMDKFIEEMRVGQRKSMMPFQKGILLCNESLRNMFIYIQHLYSSEEFNIKYILTRRLNQDILENFFSYIRSMGAASDHPTPVEVPNRLKWYILGKHSNYVISQQRNIEGDSTSTMLIEDIHHADPIDLHDQTYEEEKNTEGLFMYKPQLKDRKNILLKDITNIRDEVEDEYSTQEETSEGIKTLKTIFLNK